MLFTRSLINEESVVVRPVIGVLDGVSNITGGLQNTVKSAHPDASSLRTRMPRHITHSKHVEVFS